MSLIKSILEDNYLFPFVYKPNDESNTIYKATLHPEKVIISQIQASSLTLSRFLSEFTIVGLAGTEKRRKNVTETGKKYF